MPDIKTWKVRSEGVTHQNIEGEVIAIHMARGTYHSLTGAAAVVWGELVSEPQSVETLNDAFDAAPKDSLQRLQALIEQLVEQDLVEPADITAATSMNNRVAWEEPVMESFDDMQDLLLADPIHDVDERGWPSLASADDHKN